MKTTSCILGCATSAFVAWGAMAQEFEVPVITTLRDGRQRILLPDGRKEFLLGTNKCWRQFYFDFDEDHPELRWAPDEVKGDVFTRERISDMRDFAYNAMAKDWVSGAYRPNDVWKELTLEEFNDWLTWQGYAPASSEEEAVAFYAANRGWMNGIGSWRSVQAYRIAEEERIPHFAMVNFYPPEHFFEDYSEAPDNVKAEQQFPDLWHPGWAVQMQMTARMAARDFRYHQYLAAYTLGNEPPFVVRDKRFDGQGYNPGFWQTPRWTWELWNKGPGSPARNILVDLIEEGAGGDVDVVNAWLVANGFDPIPAGEDIDWLRENDLDLPEGFGAERIPTVLTIPVMRAASIQWHKVCAAALKEEELRANPIYPRHLIGSTGFAGSTYWPEEFPVLLEGVRDNDDVDLIISHEYRIMSENPDLPAKMESLSAFCNGKPYVLEEFTYVCEAIKGPFPPGYPRVDTVEEKIYEYTLYVDAMSSTSAPGCLGATYHAEVDHATHVDPATGEEVTGQWGIITWADKNTQKTQRYDLWLEGIRDANRKARGGLVPVTVDPER